MIFLGSSNAARYVCWNHVKAHPAMRHSWRIAENGKATKNQQRHKLPQNVIKILATKPYDPEGKIEHWSWLINVSAIGNGASCLLSNKMFSMAGWESGHFLFNLLHQMVEFHYIIFQWCAVQIFTCLRSKKWALYTQIHAHSRERELHSSLSKSFKTWYISKNSQIFPACTSIFYTLA